MHVITNCHILERLRAAIAFTKFMTPVVSDAAGRTMPYLQADIKIKERFTYIATYGKHSIHGSPSTE
jgi:hypothetical protein